MGVRMTSKSKAKWSRWALAAMLGATLMLGASGSAARAEDDEEFELPDTKFFNSFMHSMGFRKEGDQIEYRERAPLVLPTTRDLPPPEKDGKTKIANWPDDPDVKRAKKAKGERKFSNPDPTDASRPLMPQQYSLPGGASSSSRPTGPSKTIEDHVRAMSPAELGSKSVFSSLWGWGSNKEEYATFTTEPTRDRLVDPPTGYRTPSPNQPYGVGKTTWSANQTPVQNRNDAVK
jgi:hypothetical protein